MSLFSLSVVIASPTGLECEGVLIKKLLLPDFLLTKIVFSENITNGTNG